MPSLLILLLFLLWRCNAHPHVAQLLCFPPDYYTAIGKIELHQGQNTQGLKRIQDKLDELNLHCPGPHSYTQPPNTCGKLYDLGNEKSGIYVAQFGGKNIYIFCEFHPSGTHWIVFQRRISSDHDFFLTWKDYKNGFGEKHLNFWLGLENLYTITTMRRYKLRIDMEDWDGNIAYAEYSYFEIMSEGYNYTLKVRGYRGDAGDSLSLHHKQPFSTKDRDNDSSGGNCANDYLGGWWYKDCLLSNLNGYYYDWGKADPKGVNWHSWKNRAYSLKKVEMKMRPVRWA